MMNRSLVYVVGLGPGGAQFLFDFLYNRQHKCTSFISGRSTKIDRIFQYK